MSRRHTVVTLRLRECAQCAVGRQAGRQALRVFSILDSRFFSSPLQPNPTQPNRPGPKSQRFSRRAIRASVSERGIVPRARRSRGRERRETRRVISEVTGHGSRPAAVMALSEPGQCWTAGRLVGWLDDDDDGTGAWRTKWFVCYVAGVGAGAGAWASCLCFAGFLGFLGFWLFWLHLRLFSVLSSMSSMSSRTPLVSLMRGQTGAIS